MLAFIPAYVPSPGFRIGPICAVPVPNPSPICGATLQPINSLAPAPSVTLLESSTSAQAIWNDILVKRHAVSAMESHACEKYRGVGVRGATRRSGSTPHLGETKFDVLCATT